MNKTKIWFIIFPIILFIMLAGFVESGLTLGFEGWTYKEVSEEMSPVITNIMKITTHIGDAITVIIICLLLFVFQKSRKTIAIPVSIAVIIAATLNLILKNIFARDRPNILRLIHETDYSFPSGHAMINAALYTILIFFVLKYIKNIPEKIILSTFFVCITISIGYSRIYLGVHYLGDILGGWLLGATIGYVIYLISQKYSTKIKNIIQK